MSNVELWLQTDNVAETQALGERLGRHLQAGDTLALLGDLGSGKTAFAQGVARGLGIQEAVTSPTFTLINQYRAPAGTRLQHVDCYRLRNAALEMWDVGLADLLAGDEIVIIEWADRIGTLLPEEHLAIGFEWLDEQRRRLHVIAHGARPAALAHILAGSGGSGEDAAGA